MSILGFLFKSKKKMEQKFTKPVKVGKYRITSHAQNRIVEDSRQMDKFDVLHNLFTKPNGISKVGYDEKGPSYRRVGKRITVAINPKNNKVTTCMPVTSKDKREFGLINIGKKGGKKKYVKRSTQKKVYAKSKGRSKKNTSRTKYHKIR